MLRRTTVSVGALCAFVFLAFGSSGGSSDFDFDDLGDIEIDVDDGDDDNAGSDDGAPAGGGSGNAAACRTYVEKFNGLDCTTDTMNIDGETMCGNLDLNPNDMTKYWNCMAEKAGCKEIAGQKIPDLADQKDCAPLLRVQ